MIRGLYWSLIVLILVGCSQKKTISINECNYQKKRQQQMNSIKNTCNKNLGSPEYKECVYEFNKIKKLGELKNRMETFNKCSKQHLEGSGTY